METVGNAEDARFIHEWHERRFDGGFEAYAKESDAPKGWKFLGAGKYRSVWRSPEGVAYKVEHNPYRGYGQTNSEEYDKVRFAWSCDPLADVRLPRVELYSLRDDVDVIAMECISGKTVSDQWGDRYWLIPQYVEDVIEEMCHAYGLHDLHSGNVMVTEHEEGQYELTPVDFGC